jgi:hypothetical protein
VDAAPGCVRKTCLKMGMVSADTTCSVKRWFGCLSGHPAAMSGLATVMYALVFMATSHWFSLIQPCDQASVGHICEDSVRWEAVMCTPAFPFSAGTRSLLMIGYLSCPPLCCYSVAIQTFLSVPVCLLEVFHIVFPWLSITASLPRIGLVPTA